MALERQNRANPFSIAQDSYERERAYDRARTRGKRRAAVLKTFAMLLALPVVLVAVFVGAYAVTCIVNGAHPDEVPQLMLELYRRIEGFARDIAAG